jgi:hypothetical protein
MRPGATLRLVAGLAVAAAAALTIAVPKIGSLSTWKVVLGVIGLAIFVWAGRQP